MSITPTIQIEEAIWVGVSAYAVIGVHFLAQREARKDELEAKRNNFHLNPRVRANAFYLAHVRKITERVFMFTQCCFGVAGVRGLFLAPAPGRDPKGTLFAILLLVSGELALVYASRKSSVARHKVRTGTAPLP